MRVQGGAVPAQNVFCPCIRHWPGHHAAPESICHCLQSGLKLALLGSLAVPELNGSSVAQQAHNRPDCLAAPMGLAHTSCVCPSCRQFYAHASCGATAHDSRTIVISCCKLLRALIGQTADTSSPHAPSCSSTTQACLSYLSTSPNKPHKHTKHAHKFLPASQPAVVQSCTQFLQLLPCIRQKAPRPPQNVSLRHPPPVCLSLHLCKCSGCLSKSCCVVN
jgi:hypothetical protein